MRKFLYALVLGLSMITMSGCSLINMALSAAAAYGMFLLTRNI